MLYVVLAALILLAGLVVLGGCLIAAADADQRMEQFAKEPGITEADTMPSRGLLNPPGIIGFLVGGDASAGRANQASPVLPAPQRLAVVFPPDFKGFLPRIEVNVPGDLSQPRLFPETNQVSLRTTRGENNLFHPFKARFHCVRRGEQK